MPRGGTTSEGRSEAETERSGVAQGGNGVPPGKQTKPYQGHHREPSPDPPAGVTERFLSPRPDHAGFSTSSSEEPDHHSPGLWGLALADALGSSGRVCWARGPSEEVRCGRWSGGWVEETGTSQRHPQEAPVGALGGDFGTAWFACSGELRSPLVRLLPPPSSSSRHNSPSDASVRTAPFWRSCPRSRRVCSGSPSAPQHRTSPRPAGDCARGLAPPISDVCDWSAEAPRVRFAHGTGGEGDGDGVVRRALRALSHLH